MTLLIVALITIAVMVFLNTIVTVAYVGKPRVPTTPGIAAFGVVFNLIELAVLITAAVLLAHA